MPAFRPGTLPDTIGPILDALDNPVALARALGLLARRHQRQARGVAVLCPLHGEKNSPSLSLCRYRDGRLGWRCFACDAHGDALDLIARVGLGLDPSYRHRGAELRQVLERAYDLAGLPWPETPSAPARPARRLAPRPVLAPEPDPVRRVDPATFDRAARVLLAACPLAGDVGAGLAFRGVLAEAQADGWGELPAGSTPPGMAPGAWLAGLRQQLDDPELEALGWLVQQGRLERPAHRLLLPWRRADGSVWAVQRRYAPRHGDESPPQRVPKYLMPGADWTGGEAWPYGLDHDDLRTAREVWICEGALDVLALRALNRRRPAPRPMAALGLPGVARWRQVLTPALPWLRDRHVVLALDADRAGREAVAALGAAMHQAGALAVSDKAPPSGAKDWAELTAMLWREGKLR